jgi:hypothetical protein
LNQGQAPHEPVEFIGNHIRALAEKGATKFLVPNLAAPLNTSQQDLLGANEEFNALLAAELAELRNALEVTIYEVDTKRIFDEIVANPTAFGFSNIADPACTDCGAGLGSSSQVVENPEQYLLWDNVHYTARGNEIFGDGAFLSLIVPGDMNNSGRIDTQDIDLIRFALGEGGLNLEADMNLDGAVTVDDQTFWLDRYAKTSVGDTDLDGEVNFDDFLRLSRNFGNEGGWAEGNFGLGEIVGFDDFLALSANFDVSPPAAVVPEPNCAALVWLGVLSVGLVVRRRRA